MQQNNNNNFLNNNYFQENNNNSLPRVPSDPLHQRNYFDSFDFNNNNNNTNNNTNNNNINNNITNNNNNNNNNGIAIGNTGFNNINNNNNNTTLFGNVGVNNFNYGNNNNNTRFYRQVSHVGRWTTNSVFNIISFIPYNEKICFLVTNKNLVIYNYINNQTQLTIDVSKGMPLAERMLKLKNKKVLLINNNTSPQFSIIC
jgi:hypothetical protein